MKDTIARKVIEYYSQYDSMHQDLLHTIEVVTYTHLIAMGEGLDSTEVDLLESAAWLHDIGCPESQLRFGNSLPVNQQSVGAEVTEKLLAKEEDLDPKDKQWLCEVVGTHHQFDKAQKLNFTPLFEADLIVNLLSGYHPRENAEHLYNSLMRSETGKNLFKTLIK